jgi:hypothetical protein
MTSAPASVSEIASRVQERASGVEVPRWVPDHLRGLYEWQSAKTDEHDAAALTRALKKRQAVTL